MTTKVITCANCYTLNRESNRVCCGCKAAFESEASAPRFTKETTGITNNNRTNSRSVTYASLGRRVLAQFIDRCVIFGSSVAFCAVVVIASMAISGEYTDTGREVVLVGAMLGDMLYFIIMEPKYRRTIGKKALDIEVTDFDGNNISYGQAVGRALGRALIMFMPCIGFFVFEKILSVLMFGIGSYLIMFALIAFTKKKQCFHDIISKCVVVNSK